MPRKSAPFPERTLARPSAETLLVSLPRAAEAIGVSYRTAKRMAAEGELPGVRRVRRRLLVYWPELRAWAEKGCPPIKPAARGRRRTG